MTGLVAIKQNRAGNFNFGQQIRMFEPVTRCRRA